MIMRKVGVAFLYMFLKCSIKHIYYFGDLKWLNFSVYFVSPHFRANELLVIPYTNLNIKRSRVDSAYCFPFSLKYLK